MTTNKLINKPTTDDTTLTGFADILVKSRFFTDVSQAAQAVVKIKLGESLGIDPVTAMMGIYLVKGRLSLSANLMARTIKSSGKYDYRIREHSPTKCRLEIFERNPLTNKLESAGFCEYTLDEAKAAGLVNGDNWKKHPKNMLFARCITNAAKWFTPDAFGGAPVYLPDEIPGSGLVVDGETLEVVSSSSPATFTSADDARLAAKELELKELMAKHGLNDDWLITVCDGVHPAAMQEEDYDRALNMAKARAVVHGKD